MMEEKWERVGEETSLQHMHLKKKQNKKEKWALRAYLFSSPMVVEYDYGSLQSPFQALTNGNLQSPFQALTNGSLQSPFNLLKN
jgi:hypothetical protein